MSVSTLRPNSTLASSSVSLTGGAAIHGVLSDNSDSSYAAFDNSGDFAHVGLGAPSLPAGAVIKACALRVRAGVSSGVVGFSGAVFGTSAYIITATSAAYILTTPTTYVVATVSTGDVPTGVELARPGGGSLVLRLYEVYVDVTYVEQPELAVTGPSGAVTDTNLVLAEWTPNLDADGNGQTRFEVVVTADGDDPDSDPRLIESGVVASSASSWQASMPLADDAYDVHVRIAQTVNGQQHWSDWEKGDFTLAVSRPAEPTVTLVAETPQGRIRVDIEEGADGAATTDIFEVQASDDGGTTWRKVRTVAGQGLVDEDSGGATAWDREGGNGQEVTYRVRAGHDHGAGLFAWSAWVQEVGMWGPTRTCWLKHPLDPAQDLAVRIDAYGESSIAPRQGQMHPLGRSSVIFAADKHGPETGAVAFLTPDQDARDALKALLRANPATPLLLQVGATDKRPDRWVIFGQIDIAYVVDKAYVGDTRETLGWTEVPRP